MQWIVFLGIYILPVLLMLIKQNSGEMSCMSKDHTTTAKGLAMLCVMLCHYMGHFGGGVTYFTPLGGTGVAAFLILSGYGLNESWKKRRASPPERSTVPANELIFPAETRGGISEKGYRLFSFRISC